ncbi:MAG: FkbM family methyltransferase [Acidobacteria bacterium]|nr:FkbM family methyltransferase [Acidobacteriota bacterium]MDA1233663.1 FkbM family methyltransferase [Acidobacteriota bacterium]
MFSRRVKTLITNYLASRGLYITPSLQRSSDQWNDIDKALSPHQFRNFVDVGANVGESVEAMLRFRPDASIWAIEPNAAVYEQLSAKFQANPRVDCSNLALGAAEGRGTLHVTRTPATSFLERAGGTQPVATDEIVAQQSVEVETLDAFCRRKGIDRIDYLKIDAEGSDLDVLLGAQRLLSDGSIYMVECECGMHPGNKVHVPFETIKAHLEARNYRVFGLYEQSSEWLERKPFLRRVNALFLLDA